MTTRLLVAVDDGPRQTLEPLAARWGSPLADNSHPAAVDDAHWERIIKEADVSVLICGTSDSRQGREIEASARRMAAKAGIPIIVIEDYPGNFFDVPGAHTDLLIAESRFSEEIYRNRLGVACPPIRIFCSARYDRYRVRADDLRASTRARWKERGSDAPQILWAGQPETADCLATLRRIAPEVSALEGVLLVKAHPRDRGHPEGVYGALLDDLGVRHVDITHLGVPEALALAPRLVITQFSSVAIEAGFYGIPALHLLYGDAGGARLYEKKGFDVPPYCRAGAGHYLQETGHEREKLRESLFDDTARDTIIGCFDDFFATRAQIAPALADHLVEFMGLR